MSNINREVSYTVSPFAVAIANYLLFGRIIAPDPTSVREAVNRIDATGHWWVIEAVAHHPYFEGAVQALKDDDNDIDIKLACQSFSSLFLGSVGGLIGLAEKHTHIVEASAEKHTSEGHKVGESFAPQLLINPDPNSFDGIGFKYTEGACPDCGKDHGVEAENILDNLKVAFGDDVKVNHVEAKVDAEGNITNIDDIPEQFRDQIIEVVKKIHAERETNQHPIH